MDDIIKMLYQKIPYYSTLGFKIIEIKDGRAVFELRLRNELTQNGSVHGGVLASIIDSTCACAAISLIHPKGFVTTIDLQVQFLRPAFSGVLKTIGTCIKGGKNVFFCKAEVWDEEKKLIATGTSQLLKVN